MDWLLVGALGVETLPLVAALEGKALRSRRLVSGRMGGVEVGVLTCGVGPERAASRTAAALDLARPRRGLISLGSCGALVDELPVGAVVAVAAVREEGGAAEAVEALPGWPAVDLVTVAEAVWTPGRRAALAAAGSAVCEMEAAAVRGLAREAGLQFRALKVVSDQAGGGPPDKALGRVQERNPLVIGRFLARAGRLCRDALLPAVQAAIPALPRG